MCSASWVVNWANSESKMGGLDAMTRSKVDRMGSGVEGSVVGMDCGGIGGGSLDVFISVATILIEADSCRVSLWLCFWGINKWQYKAVGNKASALNHLF